MRVRKERSALPVVIASAGVLLLVLGAYAFFTLAAPQIKQAMLNPTNNSTTKALSVAPTNEPRLYIPSLNINVPYGATENDLLSGAWWRKTQNGNPADGGNFVLAAHRFELGITPGQTSAKSPFYSLGEIKEGAEIAVDYKGTRYRYEVTKKYSVKPTAINIEDRTSSPQLTLYTCTLAGSSDGRDVVVAVPVNPLR